MSMEQDITTRIATNDSLATTVSGKVAAVNTIVAQAQTQVSDHVLNARKTGPVYRLSKNQALEGSGPLPDHWLSGNGITYTYVQSVISDRAWSDRTADEQELLTAMGRANERYTYKNFNIWRMDWTDNNAEAALFQQVNGNTAVTVAAMTKILSGSINHYWTTGAKNEWSLSGIHSGVTPYGYHNIHPIRQSTSGSMLFALPAAVAGYLPLDAFRWGFFPYIGDTQND